MIERFFGCINFDDIFSSILTSHKSSQCIYTLHRLHFTLKKKRISLSLLNHGKSGGKWKKNWHACMSPLTRRERKILNRRKIVYGWRKLIYIICICMDYLLFPGFRHQFKYIGRIYGRFIHICRSLRKGCSTIMWYVDSYPIPVPRSHCRSYNSPKKKKKKKTFPILRSRSESGSS